MRRKDDGLPPLEFQRNAVQEKPVDICEFCDIDTGRMLVPSRGGLVGPNGARVAVMSGMKLHEAMSEAARWWENTGRHAMPDARRAQDYMVSYGVASGLLNGVGWEQLAKEEKLKVLRAWWLNIGVPRFVGGLGTSQDEQAKGVTNGIQETKGQSLPREKARAEGPAQAQAESISPDAETLGEDSEPAKQSRH